MSGQRFPLVGYLSCLESDDVPYDFSFVSAPDLARDFAQALSRTVAGVKRVTAQEKVRNVRRFLEFIEGSGTLDIGDNAADLEPHHLSRFERQERDRTKSTTAAECLSFVNEATRTIDEAGFRQLSIELLEHAERLDDSWGRHTPIEPYSAYELRQIRAACIKEMRRVLKIRRHGDRVASSTGMEARAVKLLRSAGPMTRKEYPHELSSTIRWKDVLASSFLLSDGAYALVTLLTLATGLEPYAAIDLEVDAIQDLGSGFAGLFYTKKRSHSEQEDTFRSVGMTGVLGIKETTLKLTEYARRFAPVELEDTLFLNVFHTSTRAGEIGTVPKKTDPRGKGGARARLQQRYKLRTDDDDPLYIELSRVRKNFWKKSHGEHPYSLEKATRGRKTMDVAFESYFRVEALADVHDRTIKAGLTKALDVQPSASETDPEGEDGFVARCKDPRDSPYSPPGEICSDPVLGCFFCDNAVFPPGKIPTLLHLAEEARSQRAIMPSAEWGQRWGGIWVQIFVNILPQFSEKQVHAAHDRVLAGQPDQYLPYEIVNIKAR